MTRRIPGFARITSAVALAGALSALAITPASAAAPNLAYAALATGTISAGPIGEAAFPTGTSPVNLADASIAALLTTGVVTDTADATSASATIADISASVVSGVLTATADSVSSSCSFNTNTDMVSGNTSITDGQVTVLGFTAALASSPAPNTTVALLPSFVTVTLNAQSTALDGTLTVTAIEIAVDGQSLDLGTSVCNAASLAPVPVLPGKTMPVALSAVGLLGLAGTGLQLRRRRAGRES
jgi:hypothetical protein